MTVRILVVEDESSFQKMIEQYFKQQIKTKKFQFKFAKNGKEALKHIVNSSPIDLMLLDIKMPQLDGLKLLTLLEHLDLKIETIIISAYGDMNTIRKTMNLGVSDFLVKPFTMKALAKTIETQIKKTTDKSLGYIEKRYIHKKQPTGEEKEYGPYLYFRKRDEQKKLNSIYLGKEEPWLQKLIHMAENSEEQ